MTKFITILIIGISLGSAFRFSFSAITEKYSPNKPLLPIFILSSFGSFFAGNFIKYIELNNWFSKDFFTYIEIGFCIGFLLFSFFSKETVNLLKKGYKLKAIYYTLILSTSALIFGYIGYIY